MIRHERTLCLLCSHVFVRTIRNQLVFSRSCVGKVDRNFFFPHLRLGIPVLWGVLAGCLVHDSKATPRIEIVHASHQDAVRCRRSRYHGTPQRRCRRECSSVSFRSCQGDPHTVSVLRPPFHWPRGSDEPTIDDRIHTRTTRSGLRRPALVLHSHIAFKPVLVPVVVLPAMTLPLIRPMDRPSFHSVSLLSWQVAGNA